MATIQEVRAKFPQYADLSDDRLAQGLHKKYYSDLPFEDFSKRVGLQPTTEQSEQGTDVGRQVALTGRAVGEGVADTAMAGADLMVNNPMTARVNPLGAMFANANTSPARIISSIANHVAGKQIYDADSFQDLLAQALTHAGAPTPETSGEKLRFAAEKGVTGALTGAGTAGMAGSAASAVRTIAGGAAGGAAAEATKQAGGGPIAQTAAGIAGGVLASGGARSVAAEGVKRSFRGGGEEARQRTAENIAAFEDAGTTPSVGQATENRVMQATESLLSKTPGAAGVMARKGETQAAELGAGVERRASALAPKANGEQAGRAIEKGIRGEGGFVEKFKAKQSQLYDELDPYVAPQTGIQVTKTADALAKLNAAIPGAPNVSKFFQNSKMRGIEDALHKDLDQPTNATNALDEAMARLESLQQSRDSAASQARGFRAFTADQTKRAENFVPVRGMPRVSGRASNFPDRAAEGRSAAADATSAAQARSMEAGEVYKTLNSLQQAVAAAKGQLPYEAVKKLRTLVGNEMADSSIFSDVPRSKWKALYGALSADLEGAAKTVGPEASAAWTRANSFTRAGMRRLEVLDDVVDKNGGPEKVFQAAISGNKEGASTLRAVMQSLPPDAQKTLSAAVLRRLGRATAGKQDEVGEKFSTETFLTNWNGMSPNAKAVLFDRYGADFRRDMDQVAKVTANLREGSQVFRNQSGTAQATVQTSAAVGFVAALATGNVGTAAGIAGGVGAANLGARLLTHPPFVKWLAKTTRMPVEAAPVALSQLARSDDPLLKEAAAVLAKNRDQQADDKGGRSQPEGDSQN